MKKFEWTEEKDRALISAWKAGESMDMIITRIGVRRSTLYNRVRELGLKPRVWNHNNRSRPVYIPKMPHSAHPLTQVLYRLMRKHKTSIPDLAGKAGIAAETIRSWGNHNEPSLGNIIACFNAMGFELVVRSDNKPVPPVGIINYVDTGPRQ